MTWFKVDDSFYDHPKVFDAPDCAVALWTRAGSWSARNLTDGYVPAGMLARLCDDPDRAAKELVDRGLWKRSRGGYQFHDWSAYQPMREEVQASREKISSGAVLGNHRRWHVQKGVTDADCVHCQQEQVSPPRSAPDRPADGGPESGASPPVPARPVPKEPKDMPASPPARWDEFWDAFPRKDGKKEAEAAFAKALKRGVDPQMMIDGALSYADRMTKARTDRSKIKMAQGWLNNDRWDDEWQISVAATKPRSLWDN